MAADPSVLADSRSARLRPPACGQPWILTYHSVCEWTSDPYGITVSPARLDHQLAWLRRHHYTGVSVATLLRTPAAARRGLVGLTFDDGYRDFVHEALPALLRHGCSATVFVLPGRLGGSNEWDRPGPDKPLLTAEEIRTAADAGTEIGSHGLRHRDLTSLTDDELRLETQRSRELLRDLTGVTPEGFCYPYGSVDARVVDAVREAGYGYGCALTPGPPAGPYTLPRTHISHADRAVRLRVKDLRHRLRHRASAAPARLPESAQATAGSGERR
ncbi:polysaccharide deacetylase family protein [Streptomyces fulvorobeus]|uniref:Peptidoglycan/xylan/chitin deacetylase (PgdA/CDA1 family) n=1 Tax=Streptomyces fulvorobeus TaxID=284028 RepID=A0A7J0CDL0_9ACTN|nr:polysaccharide deacetylase family protein [Streptomyces fulvorobeus]NYE43500.1 peptidoglycan/xylan/chitin deacetylase (PgdA/CDA1 family) [Streptomyces fulvorobeus]GFM99973.1 polysaccharide deacetylase [Streptomyces fulvorobeus]